MPHGRSLWRLLPPALLLTLSLLVGGPAGAAASSACPSEPGWTRLATASEAAAPGGLALRALYAVASDSVGEGDLYAGGWPGLSHSADCGTTWSRVPVPSGTRQWQGQTVSSIAVTPTGALTLGRGYDAIGSTVDGGATWQVGSSTNGYAYFSNMMAASAAEDGVVYAVLVRTDPMQTIGLGRSGDSGATWVTQSQATPSLVAASTLDANVIYLAFSGCRANQQPCEATGRISRSFDGGVTFDQLAELDAHVTALTVADQDAFLLAATEDDQVYESRDHGVSWTAIPAPAARGQIISLSASWQDPDVVFAATNYGEVWAFRQPTHVEPTPLIRPDPTTHCFPDQTPTYTFGFATLAEQLGPIMGEPLTCEFKDPAGSGRTQQGTTTGLAFYNPVTNTASFTNGWDHWAWTARGLLYWTGSSVDPPRDAQVLR